VYVIIRNGTGKAITYDGENRPLTVTSANGDLTKYI
jgi:YD repeat-containing protein